MPNRRFLECLLWVAGSLPVLPIVIVDVRHLNGWRVGDHVMWGRDFLNVWAGGRMLLTHHLDWLYNSTAYHRFLVANFGPLDPHNYSYPPVALFLDAPFGALPYPLAYAMWTLLGLLLFAWAAAPFLCEAGLPRALAVLTPAAIINLWAGHYGFVIGALWLFAFRSIDGAPRKAGGFTALMLLKPHLAVLIPSLLLQRGAWQAIASAAAGVALLVFTSGAVFGFVLWWRWLCDVTALQASMIHGPALAFQTMMPTADVTLQALLPARFADAMQAVTAIAAFGLISFAGRNRASSRRLCFPAATATFLILPYAFDYDMTVASLGLMLTLHRRWDAITLWERTLLAAGFMLPQWCIPLAQAGLPLAPFLLIGALVAQLSSEGLLIRSAPPRTSPSPASPPPDRARGASSGRPSPARRRCG